VMLVVERAKRFQIPLLEQDHKLPIRVLGQGMPPCIYPIMNIPVARQKGSPHRTPVEPQASTLPLLAAVLSLRRRPGSRSLEGVWPPLENPRQVARSHLVLVRPPLAFPDRLLLMAPVGSPPQTGSSPGSTAHSKRSDRFRSRTSLWSVPSTWGGRTRGWLGPDQR